MPFNGAPIRSITTDSPADDAGFVSGCSITAVDGHAIRDIIDWKWYSATDAITVSYIDTDGDSGTIELERDPGEDWGFTFDGTIFDAIKTCRNACTFCFMRQLPEDARDSLMLRDDDFRLSFLDGTFVTFTNLSTEDEARVIEQRISPLRMSLHAISPEVRKGLIGKHESAGIEAATRLLAAGIELHLQIVLVPGVNDGSELAKTLSWAYEHKGVLSVGVVPLGYTKHQGNFDHSFNEVSHARSIIDSLKPFQEKALREKGNPWVYAADEFYRNAYPETLLENLPSTAYYGSFDMFEDGIGIIRTTVDSWFESTDLIDDLAAVLRNSGKTVQYVIGYAQKEFFIPLVENSPLKGLLVPFAVKNDYFGGNVDVTGLLCGCDIIKALNAAHEQDTSIKLAVLPRVIFNSEGMTLDDMSLEDMQKASSVQLAVVSCNPSEYLEEIAALI